jgi:hypothetical protein
MDEVEQDDFVFQMENLFRTIYMNQIYNKFLKKYPKMNKLSIPWYLMKTTMAFLFFSGSKTYITWKYHTKFLFIMDLSWGVHTGEMHTWKPISGSCKFLAQFYMR